ncbi:MAG: ABC transporter permease [Chloroflexi bacterium]|nr:ABC transporter permease [Chloroflexota bacterium]
MNLLRSLARRALLPGLSVLSALILGGVGIIITDFDHLSQLGSDPLVAIGGAVSGVFNGYGAMIAGAFGDPSRIATALQTGNERDIATAIRPLTETLVAAMPLIFVGLAVAISFRAGMFNIGGDGQLILGALGATIVAIALQTSGLPSLVILVLAIAASVVAGALWGFIPGFLKARTGAHEVITTIMLNYVAAQIVLFALIGPFLRQAGSSQPISKSMTWVDVPPIVTLPAIRLDWGFVVALVMAGVVSWLLFKTTKGFELRAAGFSPTAARYAGMSAGGSMMLAMSLSGALAGMGGGFMVIGTVGQLSNDLSGGIGFNAIALALLAGLRPSGVVLAALLFGALTTGGKEMGIQTGIPFDLLFFIIALVIMFVAAPGLIRSIWRVRVKPAADVPSMAPSAPAGTV